MKFGRIIFYIIGILGIGLWPAFAHASDAPAQFQQGITAYNNANYEASVRAYEAVLSEGFFSSELFNNLGLAYAKSDELAKAALHFGKALKEAPDNTTARENLLALQKAVENRPVQKLDFSGLFVANIASNLWAILFFILLLGGAIGLGGWLLKGMKLAPLMAVLLWIGAGVAFFMGHHSHDFETTGQMAFMMNKKAGLYTAPNLKGEELRILYEGTILQVEQTAPNWVKVRLEDKTIGWVAAQMIEIV